MMEPRSGSPFSPRAICVRPTPPKNVATCGAVIARPRTGELWAVRGEAAPEPAGLLTRIGPDLVMARMTTLPRPHEVTAFAVSIEPAGGSPKPTPTGPVVLAGAVQG